MDSLHGLIRHMSKAVENEFKFTTDRISDKRAIMDGLESFLEDHDVKYKVRTRLSVDTYYDSKELDLYRSGCSLRNKASSKGKFKLTAKRPISNEKGVMSREEIEDSSDGSFRSLEAFGKMVFPGVKIQKQPVLTLKSERVAFYYIDEGNEIMLSLDVCKYVSGDLSKDFLEIEIEFMGDSAENGFDSLGLSRFVTDKLRFESVTKSKYQRGMEWISSANAQI